MDIYVIAVGRRMPNWVAEGYREYARRLPRQCALHLIEIAAAKRRKTGHSTRWKQEEQRRLLAAIPANSIVVACHEQGELWSTPELAKRLQSWTSEGRDVALLVGGPDGLDSICLERAAYRWSLSPLTLPHGLVRVLLAEQIYRAFSLTSRHPYHRASGSCG